MSDEQNKTDAQNQSGDVDDQSGLDEAGLNESGLEEEGLNEDGLNEDGQDDDADGDAPQGKTEPSTLTPEQAKAEKEAAKAAKKAEKEAAKAAKKAEKTKAPTTTTTKAEKSAGAGFVAEVDELGVPKPSTTPVAELGLKDAALELEHISKGAAVLASARLAYENAVNEQYAQVEKINRDVAEKQDRLHKINARLHRDVNKRVEDLAKHVVALQSDEATKG